MQEINDAHTTRYVRWLFRLAGLYWLAQWLPSYVMEDMVGKESWPYVPVNHPEFYYGFLGLVAAWSALFLVIGQDPRRYRPLILPSALGQFSFGVGAAVLYALGLINTGLLVLGGIDLLIGVLFVLAWRQLGLGRGANHS